MFYQIRKKDDRPEDPATLAAWYNSQYGVQGGPAGYEYWDENGYEYADYEAEGWYQDKSGEWRQDPAYAQYYEEYYRQFYEQQNREAAAEAAAIASASPQVKKVSSIGTVRTPAMVNRGYISFFPPLVMKLLLKNGIKKKI